MKIWLYKKFIFLLWLFVFISVVFWYWDNRVFVDQKFWDLDPSETEIKNVYYGTSNTIFWTVYDIEIDKESWLMYIADEVGHGKSRLLITNLSWYYIDSVVYRDRDNNRKFQRISSIELDENFIYVVDEWTNVVVKLRKDNLNFVDYLWTYNTSWNEDYKFNSPSWVTVDDTYIYVLDRWNLKIKKYLKENFLFEQSNSLSFYIGSEISKWIDYYSWYLYIVYSKYTFWWNIKSWFIKKINATNLKNIWTLEDINLDNIKDIETNSWYLYIASSEGLLKYNLSDFSFDSKITNSNNIWIWFSNNNIFLAYNRHWFWIDILDYNLLTLSNISNQNDYAVYTNDKIFSWKSSICEKNTISIESWNVPLSIWDNVLYIISWDNLQLSWHSHLEQTKIKTCSMLVWKNNAKITLDADGLKVSYNSVYKLSGSQYNGIDWVDFIIWDILDLWDKNIISMWEYSLLNNVVFSNPPSNDVWNIIYDKIYGNNYYNNIIMYDFWYPSSIITITTNNNILNNIKTSLVMNKLYINWNNNIIQNSYFENISYKINILWLNNILNHIIINNSDYNGLELSWNNFKLNNITIINGKTWIVLTWNGKFYWELYLSWNNDDSVPSALITWISTDYSDLWRTWWYIPSYDSNDFFDIEFNDSTNIQKFDKYILKQNKNIYYSWGLLKQLYTFWDSWKYITQTNILYPAPYITYNTWLWTSWNVIATIHSNTWLYLTFSWWNTHNFTWNWYYTWYWIDTAHWQTWIYTNYVWWIDKNSPYWTIKFDYSWNTYTWSMIWTNTWYTWYIEFEKYDGWSPVNWINTRHYFSWENDVYIFKLQDKAWNSVEYAITWKIDLTIPSWWVNISTTEWTSGSVIVTWYYSSINTWSPYRPIYNVISWQYWTSIIISNRWSWYHFLFEDEVWNKLNISGTIKNIDNQSPIWYIEYFPTWWTSWNVVATLTWYTWYVWSWWRQSPEFPCSSGQITFTWEHQTYMFKLCDEAWNYNYYPAISSWRIDKKSPIWNIIFSTTEWTSWNVIATLNYSQDTWSNIVLIWSGIHTFTQENDSFSFRLQDEAWNSWTSWIIVDWIDKVKPSISVNDYTYWTSSVVITWTYQDTWSKLLLSNWIRLSINWNYFYPNYDETTKTWIWTISLLNVSDWVYNIWVETMDKAWNISELATWLLTIDTQKPIINYVPIFTGERTPLLQWIINNTTDIEEVKVKVDWIMQTVNYDSWWNWSVQIISDLSDWLHSVYVYVKDVLWHTWEQLFDPGIWINMPQPLFYGVENWKYYNYMPLSIIFNTWTAEINWHYYTWWTPITLEWNYNFKLTDSFWVFSMANFVIDLTKPNFWWVKDWWYYKWNVHIFFSDTNISWAYLDENPYNNWDNINWTWEHSILIVDKAGNSTWARFTIDNEEPIVYRGEILMEDWKTYPSVSSLIYDNYWIKTVRLNWNLLYSGNEQKYYLRVYKKWVYTLQVEDLAWNIKQISFIIPKTKPIFWIQNWISFFYTWGNVDMNITWYNLSGYQYAIINGTHDCNILSYSDYWPLKSIDEHITEKTSKEWTWAYCFIVQDKSWDLFTWNEFKIVPFIKDSISPSSGYITYSTTDLITWNVTATFNYSQDTWTYISLLSSWMYVFHENWTYDFVLQDRAWNKSIFTASVWNIYISNWINWFEPKLKHWWYIDWTWIFEHYLYWTNWIDFWVLSWEFEKWVVMKSYNKTWWNNAYVKIPSATFIKDLWWYSFNWILYSLKFINNDISDTIDWFSPKVSLSVWWTDRVYFFDRYWDKKNVTIYVPYDYSNVNIWDRVSIYSSEDWKHWKKENIWYVWLRNWKKYVIFDINHFSYFSLWNTSYDDSINSWWSWFWLNKDDCSIDWWLSWANIAWIDFSSSYYDRVCYKTNEDIMSQSWVSNNTLQDIFKHMIPNYQISWSDYDDYDVSYSLEENNAYWFAYKNNITTLKPLSSAIPYWVIPRKHLAKMLVNFSINILWKKPNENVKCDFDDVFRESDEMQWYMKKACQLWIMWVDTFWTSMKNFNPDWIVNRAIFWTALSRMLFWFKYNWNTENWYINHLKWLRKEWIMKNIEKPFNAELRMRVWIMLKRSEKL